MRTKPFILILVLALLPLFSFASHIVGGEIQFYPKDVTQNKYYLALNLYFDVANGRTQAEDANVTLYIFRKSDNVSVANFNFGQTTRKLISYTNQSCTNPDENLQTRLIVYSGDVVLNPENFKDPQGYYVVWERCCRNNIINNIVNPGRTGETFYLFFPPLTTINSSPVFTELKGDYICFNRPFYFSFAGKDPDGDSLVYSLVNPYAGFANSGSGAAPVARGATDYPEVGWEVGYGLNNIIPGKPALNIDRQTGRLNVHATQKGIFVFCVMVEEYRDNKRIGFLRREFQFKVVDCQPNEKPSALFREVGKSAFYDEKSTIQIKKEQKKCFEILITDPDVGEKLIVATKALNFDDKAVTLSTANYTTKNAKDTLKTQVCFDQCVESRNNQTLIWEVVVTDDGCPQGLTDTLKVRMFIEPLFNNKPKASTDLASPNVTPGTQVKFNVKGTDLDNDDIILEAKPRGFTLSSAGMTFIPGTGKGTITQPFTWNTTCNTPTDKEYVIDFVVTDISCSRQTKDTVTVRLKAVSRPNTPPTVTTSLGTTKVVTVAQPTEKVKGISFDVFADDAEKDGLTLTAVGQGANISTYKMKFTDKTGTPQLKSTFEWFPDCNTINSLVGKSVFVDFVATEDKGCTTSLKNTLTVELKIQDLPGSGSRPDQLPNVITPNGDGKNDCFVVENLTTTLCGPIFERITIVNRWGTPVFESPDKNFTWCADGLNAGQYFYNMKFTDRNYKGVISVLK